MLYINIRNFIIKNQWSQAIDLFLNYASDRKNDDLYSNIVLLSARYNRNETGNRQGTISQDSYNLERNRISNTLLDYLNDEFKEASSSSDTIPSIDRDSLADPEKQLQEIIKTNKRRRPSVAQSAEHLLQRHRAWKDAKASNQSYDMTDRRRRCLDQEIKALFEQVGELVDDKLEALVEEVNGLIGDPAPSWDNLQKAYDKLIANGASPDGWVKTQLGVRSDDYDNRIDVAERIEQMITQITAK